MSKDSLLGSVFVLRPHQWVVVGFCPPHRHMSFDILSSLDFILAEVPKTKTKQIATTTTTKLNGSILTDMSAKQMMHN